MNAMPKANTAHAHFFTLVASARGRCALHRGATGDSDGFECAPEADAIEDRIQKRRHGAEARGVGTLVVLGVMRRRLQ
jgi:hypothetical protein